MTDETTVTPPNGAQVVRNQAFTLTLKYPTTTQDDPIIEFKDLSGLTLQKRFPLQKGRKQWQQQFIFRVDPTATAPTLTISSKNSTIPDQTIKYTAVAGPKLKPDSCTLRCSSVYLYDPNPVDFSGGTPTDCNPYIMASINPEAADGTSISNIEIQLCVTQPLRIFSLDMTEIPCYKADVNNGEYWYLLQKTSAKALSLKIYATKGVSSFVSMGTVFDNTEYNQNQIVFINTVKICTSSSFGRAQIQEAALSSTLIRPAGRDYFHFQVPSYESSRVGDFIIGFSTDDRSNPYKKQICFGEITLALDGYYTFKADYSLLYEGANYISFVALNQGGNPAGSELNYVNYESGGNNGPDPDDPSRTLLEPVAKDQYGRIIGKRQPININSVGNSGISILLPSDPNNSDHTVVAGDVISIKAYISHCIDINSVPRPLPLEILTNYTIKDGDIVDNYFTRVIPAASLLNYESQSSVLSGTITFEYTRLAQAQKSKLLVRGLDTVAPHLHE